MDHGNERNFPQWTEQAFKRPSDLIDFRDLWDQGPVALSFTDTNHPGNKILLAKKNGEDSALVFHPDTIDFQSGSTELPKIIMTDKSQRDSIARLLDVSAADFVLAWQLSDGKALLPATITQTPVNVQKALLGTHLFWKSGGFSALNAATVDNHDKSFEAIHLALRQEAEKPKNDSFEVFGVKFPVEKATRWGILLIVGIQLYLWIHLHELSPRLKKGDAGWDVSWIGIYRSFPARAVFVASTACLPVATIGALGNQALRGGSAWV